MKSITMLLLVVTFTINNVLSASTATDTAETNAITTEIMKRLENPTFFIAEETTFDVTLRVNKDNEFVVLHVGTDNEVIQTYIKKRLNYSKIPISLRNKSKDYVIRIRLTGKK